MRVRFKISYLVLLFFVASMILYLNINKLPLDHPGNIKAADPFYHTLAVEQIKDTSQWNYYDTYISLGQEKAVSVQPPLLYQVSAIVSIFSGLPSWVVIFFFVCFTQALLIIVIYLLTKEVFDEESAILASLLSILPIPVHVWLYGLYIGLWIQVPSYFFIMAYIWLYIRYTKKGEDWPLIFMGISISAIMLLHPQDLGLLLLPSLLLGFLILRDTKSIRKSILFSLIPSLTLLPLIPRFLYVWGAQGSGQYTLGLYGLREVFSKDYLGGLVFPHIDFFPFALTLIYLSISLYLIVIIAINIRKDIGLPKIDLQNNSLKIKKGSSVLPILVWMGFSLYMFAIFYLTPIFFKSVTYFGRMRALQPFIMFPVISYGISQLFKLAKKKILVYGMIFATGIFLMALSYPTYANLVENTQGELIDPYQWEAYEWVHENTPEEATVLFFGGTSQSEQIYIKRISAVVPLKELQRILEMYVATNSTSPEIVAGYSGGTIRAIRKYEVSFFEYENYEDPSRNMSIYDFDYIFFSNINQQFAQVNAIFANEFINKYNFRPVFNNDRYFILKNEN